MNNSERMLLHTLPRWSGVAVTSITEQLSDMWIRGKNAGHHSGLPYDQDGIDHLRDEILKDFTTTPSVASFKPGGPMQTVDKLDSDIQQRQQKPIPPAGKSLAKVLRAEEFDTVRKRWGATAGSAKQRAGQKKTKRST